MPAQIFDEGSSVQLTAALSTLQSEMKRIYNLVEGYRDELRTAWSGPTANEFQMKINEWEEGYVEVDKQLDRLTVGMDYYLNINVTTDEEIKADVGGWYSGHK